MRMNLKARIMKIDHVALYCLNLEGMRKFFIRYFHGVSNGMYNNPKTGLKTYMLSFENSDANKYRRVIIDWLEEDTAKYQMKTE